MKDSDRKVMVVPASLEFQTFTAPGTKCMIESASAPFGIQFDGGNLNVGKTGIEYDRESEPFRTITIRRILTAKLTVVLWVGTARVVMHFPVTPPTALVPRNGAFAGTGVGSAILLEGVATDNTRYSDKGIAPGQRRKQFVVSNRNANFIYLYDHVAAVVFTVIAPNSDYTIETDADFKIYGTVADLYYVAELFNL